MQSIRVNTLRVDNSIRFGSHGNYLTFAPQGFSGDEHGNHTWNDGCVATLRLRILALAEDTQLRVDIDPYIVPEKVPFQTLNVYVNGLWIAFARSQGTERLLIDLPADFIVPTTNRLSFVMANATRPAEIGEARDQRLLAFSFREIALIRST
jgi:hypothetical protein